MQDKITAEINLKTIVRTYGPYSVIAAVERYEDGRPMRLYEVKPLSNETTKFLTDALVKSYPGRLNMSVKPDYKNNQDRIILVTENNPYGYDITITLKRGGVYQIISMDKENKITIEGENYEEVVNTFVNKIAEKMK